MTGHDASLPAGAVHRAATIAGILTIAWVFGIFAIAAGLLSIALSFTVRGFGKRIGAVT